MYNQKSPIKKIDMSKCDMSIHEKLLSAPATMVAVTILVVNTAPRLDIMAEHTETQPLSVIFNM